MGVVQTSSEPIYMSNNTFARRRFAELVVFERSILHAGVGSAVLCSQNSVIGCYAKPH
jgi:hypothetical protein